jgi:hypothetical protein
MTATEKRNLVVQLAVSDPDRALVIARRIKDPWFACQALAWVARYSPEHQFEEIIDESLHAGSTADDPFKIVASSAWPLRALIERGHLDKYLSIIPELLNRAKEIELLASRSEALFLVFQAVFPAGRGTWFDVLQGLMNATTPMINWRQKRNLRDTILIIRMEDEELANALTNSLEDSKLKKQIERRIANSELRLPRPFFWQPSA